MIAIIGHIDVDPAVRDRLIASTVELQAAARDEAGCLAYTMSADPALPGRIAIVELWESPDTLDADFQHPNFHATGAALRAEPRVGGSVMKYHIDAIAPVRGDDGVATAAFGL